MHLKFSKIFVKFNISKDLFTLIKFKLFFEPLNIFGTVTEYLIIKIHIFRWKHKNEIFREAMRVSRVTFTVYNMNNIIKFKNTPMFQESSRLAEK